MRTLLILIALLLHTHPVQAGDKLTIMLDWFVNPDHAALVIAKEKGLFTAQGLDVELQQPGDPNDPPKLLAAGKVDLAIGYQPQLHIAVDQGLPLRRVGALVAQPLCSLMVLEKSGIAHLKQLKGRKIGYSVGGVEEALLNMMLRQHGLTLRDISLVNVNFALAPALLSGQVDAVIGAFRNFETHQIAAGGGVARIFPVENEGVPFYDELIILARAETTNDNRIPRLLGALTQAVQMIKADPKGTKALFFKAYPETQDGINEKAWNDTVPLLAEQAAALDTRRYQDFSAFLAQHGLIKKAQDPTTVAATISDKYSK